MGDYNCDYCSKSDECRFSYMSTYCEANSYNARNIFTKDELASIKLFNTFIKNLRKKYDENGELPLGVESLINGVHLNMTYLVNYLEEPLDKE